MLHRTKLIRELAGASHKLFINYSQEHEEAIEVFKQCIQDPELAHLVAQHPSLELVSWSGIFFKTYFINHHIGPYQVVAVDGSQLYPDKHQGTHCYLVNIGTILFRYELPRGSSNFSSEPFLFLPDPEKESSGYLIDEVDAKREELEFLYGILASTKAQDECPQLPLLFLFDVFFSSFSLK